MSVSLVGWNEWPGYAAFGGADIIFAPQAEMAVIDAMFAMFAVFALLIMLALFVSVDILFRKSGGIFCV